MPLRVNVSLFIILFISVTIIKAALLAIMPISYNSLFSKFSLFVWS